MEISVYSRPPEQVSKKIRKRIRDIKKYFGKNRSSIHPLPHLTIRSSFKIPKNKFSEVCNILIKEFRKLRKPLIKISGWGTAPKSSDVYGFHLKVKKNPDLLKIHNRLENLFPNCRKTYKIAKFEPHISLAWNMKNEMKKQDFMQALEFMKKTRKFEASYVFNKLYIHEKIGKDNYKFLRELK